MKSSEDLLPYSIESFLSDDEIDRLTASIDAYKKANPHRLEAGAKGLTIHSSGNPSIHSGENTSAKDLVSVYEPSGRLDINWMDIPKDVIEIVERRFYERIEDIRRAFPSAYGPYGFTYVEYRVGQYFTAHIDGIGTEQVAGFGVTLTDDFDGGEFSVETCGSGRLWINGKNDNLMVAPGHDASSEWYRSLPRAQWTTRPKRGNALFYGSGLTHSSKPVTRGVLKKLLAFIRAEPR